MCNAFKHRFIVVNEKSRILGQFTLDTSDFCVGELNFEVPGLEAQWMIA